MQVFSISGYFPNEDGSKDYFVGQLVAEYDHVPGGYDEDDIFYFGMSETQIQEAIEDGDDSGEFVITGYEEVKLND